MLRHMEASITFDRNHLVFRNRLCYILHTIERARTCIKYFTVAMSHRFNQNMAFVCVCVFLNCSLLPFLFPHFPFNVFTSYLIILPHRKRQTFICIFLVNVCIHLCAEAKWCSQCDESRIMFTYTVVSSCHPYSFRLCLFRCLYVSLIQCIHLSLSNSVSAYVSFTLLLLQFFMCTFCFFALRKLFAKHFSVGEEEWQRKTEKIKIKKPNERK